MDNYPLPVFEIESENEESEEEAVVSTEIKNAKYEHLHKLLSDRSIYSHTNNPNSIIKKLEAVAEENLLNKELKEVICSLPGNPRSTFLMVFSPDGSKVASSHGDHNIHVTDLRTNKCISTLTGHPRTPWSIAFHPHRNDILASGCLGGQVRVWDLHGGSEMWIVTSSEPTTVIASLAFHPSERLLVIAINSTLYFWDWNLPQPFAKCSTATEKQKLRYVCFDPLGNWLLTGISNGPRNLSQFSFGTTTSQPVGQPLAQPTPQVPPQLATQPPLHAPATVSRVPTAIQGIYRLERTEQERERNLQSRYHTLLDQYERLRFRYQELRYRAAELELNATNSRNSSGGTQPEPEALANQVAPEARVPSTSSSDQFWQTLMNAAENLRAVSNIGLARFPPTPQNSGTRMNPLSLDYDARLSRPFQRIQLLSCHIENMQRICRSHLEITRHHRQVYRLQQIRRILEDLREQIRYLQVVVRDSIDIMSQLRPAPAAASTESNSSMATSNATVEGPSPSQENHSAPSYSQRSPRLTTSENRRGAAASFRPRFFNSSPYCRLQRNRSHNYRNHTSLRQPYVDQGRGYNRRSHFRPSHFPTAMQQMNPAASLDHPIETVLADNGQEEEEESASHRRHRNRALHCRRSRFSRFGQRGLNNSLLHVGRNSMIIQRRKPSALNRVFHFRCSQSRCCPAPNNQQQPVPSSIAFTLPSTHQSTSQRSTDQTLRPLMERLESHFRLQRQTMGILAQLNEASGRNTSDFSDSSISSRPWATDVIQNLRNWRSRRESLERTHSLDSRPTHHQFQVPRSVDGNFNYATPTSYRSFRPIDDDDSSDTDTDLTTDSNANRWRQSNPIRTPRGIEQRMRLLWREYLTQVVHAQNNSNQNSTQETENDASAQQERIRYRLWLSTMVESLTSFFSQHGINSTEPDTGLAPTASTSAYAAPVPTASIASTPASPTSSPPGSSPTRSSPPGSLPSALLPPLLSSATPSTIDLSTSTNAAAFVPTNFISVPSRPRNLPPASVAPRPLVRQIAASTLNHYMLRPIATPPFIPNSINNDARDTSVEGTSRPALSSSWGVFPRVGLVTSGMGDNGGGVGVTTAATAAATAATATAATATAATGAGVRAGPNGPGEVYGVAGQRFNMRRNAESQVCLTNHITYRIQAWDFSEGFIPDIQDAHTNVVVPESKLHNDASVDVSADGRLLVTLVPCSDIAGALISLHSLESSRLGDCLAQVHVDQYVVSVSISPTCRHLLFGLASPRAQLISRDSTTPTLWAQVYKIPDKVLLGSKKSNVKSRNQLKTKCDSQHALLRTRDLYQMTDVGLTSLNCIRWIPTPGQGFVLGTNKGHLKVIH